MIKNKIIIGVVVIFFMVNISVSEASISETGSRIEKYEVSLSMKKRILHSTLRTPILSQSGKKIMAYMYAEDEKITLEENDSRDTGETYTSLAKHGHYYLYLYDMSMGNFLPERVAIFKDFDGIWMNSEGASFFTWPSMSKNQSDIILVSQFCTGRGDTFEAYGLSKDQLHIKKYWFNRDGKRQEEFYGRINIQKPEPDGTLVTYSILDYKIHQYKFLLTDISGEIKLVPYDLLPSEQEK